MRKRIGRREWIIGSASALGLSAFVPARQLLAAALARTPSQTAGPFYPLVRSRASGNDLVHVPGQPGVAAGELTTVAGRVVDADGRPFAGALVEIWQANGHGRYNDPRDASSKPLDPAFTGYGTCMTDAEGRYVFHTIKPVPYPGRAPHIHFKLEGDGFDSFITQVYVAGARENERDGLFRSLDPAERKRVVVDLEKGPANSWHGAFDIVLARRG